MICKAPFVSQAQWANGTVQMCCNDTDGFDGTLAEEWASDSRRLAQEQWLRGEVPDRCKPCWKGYQAGGGVDLVTHYSTFEFKERVELPQYLHLSPHNNCQLACRMCSAGNSTSYGKVHGQRRVVDNRQSTIEFVRQAAPYLVNYTFHGGEPMNDSSFLDILEILHPHREQMKISVLSNGMSLKSRGVDVIPLLREFPNLEYMLSIDGAPAINEHQRALSNTKTMVENYNRIAREIPHCSMRLNHTLTNTAVMGLADFYRFVEKSLDRIDGINHGPVDTPIAYQAQNLPPMLREKARLELAALNEEEFCHGLGVELRRLKLRIDQLFQAPFLPSQWAQYIAQEREHNRAHPGSANVIKMFMA